MESQDPALDISHQYPHERVGAHTVDETAYTKGKMSEDGANPPQFSHEHSKDIESGVLAHEKASTRDISQIGSATSIKSDGVMGAIYKKYRIFVHAFIFCLFTG